MRKLANDSDATLTRVKEGDNDVTKAAPDLALRKTKTTVWFECGNHPGAEHHLSLQSLCKVPYMACRSCKTKRMREEAGQTVKEK